MPNVEVVLADMGTVGLLVYLPEKKNLTYLVIGDALQVDETTIERLEKHVRDTRPTRSYVMSVAEANELVERKCLK
jgi:hypothetical protein